MAKKIRVLTEKQIIAEAMKFKKRANSKTAYDPEVTFGIHTMPLQEFKEFVLSLGRFNEFTLDYQILELYLNVTLKNRTGHYSIENSLFKQEFPSITTAMLTHPFDVSPIQDDYIKIFFGMRATKGYWSAMSTQDLKETIVFGLKYILDIDSYDKAIRLKTPDVAQLRIPPKNRAGIRIYDMVKMIYPDVKVWDIRTPEHAFDDVNNVIACMIELVTYYERKIDSLSALEIKAIAPNLLNKFRKKALVAIWNDNLQTILSNKCIINMRMAEDEAPVQLSLIK